MQAPDARQSAESLRSSVCHILQAGACCALGKHTLVHCAETAPVVRVSAQCGCCVMRGTFVVRSVPAGRCSLCSYVLPSKLARCGRSLDREKSACRTNVLRGVHCEEANIGACRARQTTSVASDDAARPVGAQCMNNQAAAVLSFTLRDLVTKPARDFQAAGPAQRNTARWRCAAKAPSTSATSASTCQFHKNGAVVTVQSGAQLHNVCALLQRVECLTLRHALQHQGVSAEGRTHVYNRAARAQGNGAWPCVALLVHDFLVDEGGLIQILCRHRHAGQLESGSRAGRSMQACPGVSSRESAASRASFLPNAHCPDVLNCG